MSNVKITKNRNREEYTFANINLLGKCNANCYFCLGKDIPDLLNIHNQTQTHFREWSNFSKFLELCKEKNIKKIYLTGQNTDALCYKYFGELVEYIQGLGFDMGIRTNGYLIPEHINDIRKLRSGVGLSIHTLKPETNKMIMGREDILDWERLIPAIKSNTNHIRVAIVINRYNKDEVIDLIKYLSKFDEIQYIQARRISTDTREDELIEDVKLYEAIYQKVIDEYNVYNTFYNAQRVNMFGKEVCWWRTVETSANSINYFTDGTISGNYFVVEGYINNRVEEVR